MKTFGDKKDNLVYKDRQGVYALIPDQRGGLAIVGRIDSDHHELPGGGLEGEETHEEGLKRELKEELGWAIEIGEYLGCSCQYVISARGNPWRMIGYFYHAEKVGEIGGKVEDDHVEVWLSKDEATRRVFHDYQRWAIRSFVTGKVE